MEEVLINREQLRSQLKDCLLDARFERWSGAYQQGKVRDMYDLGDSLLLIASDRLSAFDVVMPNGIPDKGKVLTSMAAFWFDWLDWMPNHIIATDVSDYPEVLKPYAKDLEKRSMIVKKCQPSPVECIACISKMNCPFGKNCAFFPMWKKVQTAIYDIYDQTSIQDLLDQKF